MQGLRFSEIVWWIFLSGEGKLDGGVEIEDGVAICGVERGVITGGS